MGFDGKTLIHPSQIAPCNSAFSPTEAEVAQARKIIAAFELPENRAKGVVQLKDLDSGEQREVALDRLVESLAPLPR